MTRNDFMVGQTVYLKTVSHLFDCWIKETIHEGVVTKIGRKYITVKCGAWEYRFNIANDFRQETEFGTDYELFLTKQAVYDYWESAYLRVSLRKLLEQYGVKIHLSALREAAKAIGIPPFIPQKKGGADNG